MATKIINLADYKERKRQRDLKSLVKEVDQDIQRAFKNGACERCTCESNDLILLRGSWRCRACLGL